MLALDNIGRQLRKERGLGEQGTGVQGAADTRKNRPQEHALLFREPGFAAQTRNIAILLPACQLPRIDHLLPFCEQKLLAEFVGANGACGFL